MDSSEENGSVYPLTCVVRQWPCQKQSSPPCATLKVLAPCRRGRPVPRRNFSFTCTAAVILAVPQRLIVPSPHTLRCRVSGFSLRIIASPQKILFPPPWMTLLPRIAASWLKAIPQSVLSLPGILRAAVSRFRLCSCFVMRAGRFLRLQLFFLLGPTSPPLASPFARTRGGAPCSTARPLGQPLVCIWATPTRAIRSRRLSTPSSPAFPRCSSMLARMRLCATTPHASREKHAPQASPWN